MAHGQPSTRLKDGIVRETREHSGMTLRGLAARCTEAGQRVSDSQLSKIERGLHRPRPPLLKTIADILGVTVAELAESQEHAR